MPWPNINKANNQAEQLTSPQPVEYSTTVNTCRSAPNSPYKTNRNDSTLHIRNFLAPKVVHKVLSPIPIHLALSLVQPPPSKNKN